MKEDNKYKKAANLAEKMEQRIASAKGGKYVHGEASQKHKKAEKLADVMSKRMVMAKKMPTEWKSIGSKTYGEEKNNPHFWKTKHGRFIIKNRIAESKGKPNKNPIIGPKPLFG